MKIIKILLEILYEEDMQKISPRNNTSKPERLIFVACGMEKKRLDVFEPSKDERMDKKKKPNDYFYCL
jgi:hypothetical protein